MSENPDTQETNNQETNKESLWKKFLKDFYQNPIDGMKKSLITLMIVVFVLAGIPILFVVGRAIFKTIF